jgi:Protein of unknown function (DUF4031)
VTVYVDDMFRPARVGRVNGVWCHMSADTLDELHEMAALIGMRREWFQPGRHPHYDVTKSRRAAAVAAGAVETDQRTLARIARTLGATPPARSLKE